MPRACSAASRMRSSALVRGRLWPEAVDLDAQAGPAEVHLEAVDLDVLARVGEAGAADEPEEPTLVAALRAGAAGLVESQRLLEDAQLAARARGPSRRASPARLNSSRNAASWITFASCSASMTSVRSTSIRATVVTGIPFTTVMSRGSRFRQVWSLNPRLRPSCFGRDHVDRARLVADQTYRKAALREARAAPSPAACTAASQWPSRERSRGRRYTPRYWGWRWPASPTSRSRPCSIRLRRPHHAVLSAAISAEGVPTFLHSRVRSRTPRGRGLEVHGTTPKRDEIPSRL